MLMTHFDDERETRKNLCDVNLWKNFYEAFFLSRNRIGI